MKCWHCGNESVLSSFGKLSFRALCDHCHSALHCCYNCKNHQVSAPNECLIPNTDFISDRSKMNFCEEFQLLDQTKKQVNKQTIQDAERFLFGEQTTETDGKDPKSRFSALFGEED